MLMEDQFGWPQRDSNPRLGLERASPWAVISPTSTPGATARRHSAGSSAAGREAQSDDQPEPGTREHRIFEPGGDEPLQHLTLRDNVGRQRRHDGHGGGGHQRTPARPALEAD